MFKSVPINITGGSYQSRSRPLSSQETKNLYHQVVEAGKEQYVLHSFPGLKTMSTVSGIDRGMHNMKEVGYRVCGEKLYKFGADGTHTELGTIKGQERCIIEDDGVNLIIIAGERIYKYDGTDTFEIAPVNIIGSTAVTFLNNQMIYTNDNLFVVANPGLPDTANGLNAASAESQPDDLLRAYAFQQSCYMFGKRTVEPWWNTGSGFPPFERIDGQIFEVGCAAIHSIANTDEAIYWLGDDDAIYRASGGSRQRISSAAISHAISTYSDTSDAFSYTFTFEGMNFYLITFPSANQTWCLNEQLGDKGWFEVSSGTSGGKYQASSVVNVYGLNYMADDTNGNLYLLDLDTYANGGEVIQRRRITSSVNGKVAGQPGARIQMSRLELIMEAGVGLIDGQGSDPKIMIEISLDGGRSWNEQGFVRIGRLGETQLRVELFNLDSFYDAIFRISSSDAVPMEFYSAVIDLRLAGR